MVDDAISADGSLHAEGTAARIAVASVAGRDEAPVAAWLVAVVALLSFFQNGVATGLAGRPCSWEGWVDAIIVTVCGKNDCEWSFVSGGILPG